MTRKASNASFATLLRQELMERSLRYAAESGYPFEQSLGEGSSILFREDEAGRHGNFHPAAYRRIKKNPAWKQRLAKSHSSAHRIMVSHDRERKELDSCHSSDALLMNIFCHPQTSRARSPLRSYLAADPTAPLNFGYKPRIPMKGGQMDRTEVDLQIGDLMIEAKLTEADFQLGGWELAERYTEFAAVFDRKSLTGAGGRLEGYQLVRGILAAFAEEADRFCVLCDERRPDLIASWYRVVSAIRSSEQRWRCSLLTWQELSMVLPISVRLWLQMKYGVVASKSKIDYRTVQSS